MTDRPASSRRVFSWLLYFGGWLVLSVFLASQTVIYSRYAGRPVSWRQAIVYPLADAVPWSLFALLVFALARRFPIERGRIVRGLAVLLPVGLVLSILESALVWAAFQRLGMYKGSSVPALQLLGGMVVGKLHQNLITFAVLVGGSQAIDYYRKFRDREIKASQLEARLAEARLDVLRMQLQPHFLFNTLHAISALMHRDVERADHMLARLSDLLRLAMEGEGEQEVPLKREMEFLEGYLEIQQARFGERLSVALDVPAEVLDARVPQLALQPLVENAVRHGVGSRAAGGTVEIAARREGERLRITVRDDGAGFPAAEAIKAGVGLANTRARLEALYGGEASLATVNHPDGGALVTLIVPWRAPGDEPAPERGARPSSRERGAPERGAP